ncbi:uncharacterized protein LOC124433536 isoform X2 [Xenia sp. Carnegie-2017]|uniref:uncharacterized protein LOC124433536 isoform X2 n=1 Tax=Xenia sp. Carnegie-2017 TaxID=2897299 RepID=UPI001F044A2E|nr:uncharacterized protein LOC124433536 isoform X2 [Xenia sp. Carnegie-2017]
MSALSLKNERTILVSGLPDSATSKRVTMHFQKTKNGGGDIKEVKMLGQGNARVTFVDRTVAKRVLEVEQIFEATILNVQLEENELFQNVEIGKRKVLVSGLPEDITENAVKIHFQKKRNSGGDVEKVNLLKDGFAEIVFEKAEVASQVVHTQQIMKGKILNVELMENETFEREENDVYEETSDKISRSVVVSSLPEGVKKNNLHIHFQKKKNGGGDISEVQIFPDKNQALVVFDDIQVARRVVKTEQRIHGNILNLELQNDFLSKTNEITTKERTIIISDLPNDFTENDVKFHFEKKQHVDEDLGRKVEVLFIGSTALVVFENGEEAKKAAETAQIVRGETLDVNLFKEQNLADELIKKYDQNSHETMTSTHSIEKETKSEISYDSSGDHLNNEKEAENLNGAKYWKSGVTNNINPVFSEVCATIRPDLLHTASQEYWRKFFEVIQKSSSITWSHGVFGVYLKGSLDDVVKAGELLLLHWQKKFENGTNDNTDVPQETVVSVDNKSQRNQDELQTRSNFSIHQKELKYEKETPQQMQSLPGTYSENSTFHHPQRILNSGNPFFLGMSGFQNFPPIVTPNKLVSMDKKNEALHSKVDEDNKNTAGSYGETKYEEGSRKISNASIANTEERLSNFTKHSESSNTSSNHTKQSKSFGIQSNIPSTVQVDAKPHTDCVEENSTTSSESESDFGSDPSSTNEISLKSQEKENFSSCESLQDSMQNSNNSSKEHASSLSPETSVVAPENRKIAANFLHSKNTQ